MKMKKVLSILLVFTVILFMFACGKNVVKKDPANLGLSRETRSKMSAENSTLLNGYSYTDESGSTVCVDGYEIESLLCSVPTKPAQNPAKSFQEIRTNLIYTRNSEYPDFPYTVIIETSDELKKYITENEENFDFSRKDKIYADTTIGFLDAVDKYDDDFFKENSLVIAVTSQPSGSIRYWGAKLAASSGKRLCDTLILTEYHPHEGTDDCASWHIIVEAKKGTYTDEIKLQINKVEAEMPDY